MRDMNFNEEKYQLKYNDKNKIITTIIKLEKKENKNNNNNIGRYLGKKRKLFESKKNNNHNFKISRKTTIFIKSKNNKNIENRKTCIFCLGEISFENRHFLHCGHIFHCTCIKIWINYGRNFCPVCRGNIKCIYENEDEDEDEDEDDNLISLDEDENIVNNNNDDNI